VHNDDKRACVCAHVFAQDRKDAERRKQRDEERAKRAAPRCVRCVWSVFACSTCVCVNVEGGFVDPPVRTVPPKVRTPNSMRDDVLQVRV
jgi:hypothetical protein